jgi:hypothetical protein
VQTRAGGYDGKEFVQVSNEGVAVEIKKGIERVSWNEIERVRILATDTVMAVANASLGRWRGVALFRRAAAEPGS